MKINQLVTKIDEICCHYLGIKKRRINPRQATLINNKMIISHTEQYKRHIHQENITCVNLKEISKSSQEKLGVASGKAIAKHLIISFDEPTIKRIE